MEEISDKLMKEELILLKSIQKIPTSGWIYNEKNNLCMHSYYSILEDTQKITITYNDFLREYSFTIEGYTQKVNTEEDKWEDKRVGYHSIYKRHQKELKNIFDKANEPLRGRKENDIINILKNIQSKLKWK